MASRRHCLAVTMALCLLGQAFALPAAGVRRKRDNFNNELEDSRETSSDDLVASQKPEFTSTTTTEDPFEDDDDFSEPMQSSPTSGSNLFSLIRLAGALFPSSSSNQDRATTDQQTDQQQPPSSPLWTFKMDILRAVLQLGARILGSASAGSINTITT